MSHDDSDLSDAEPDLAPLRDFLLAHGWPHEVTSYDMYGGPRMTVMLEPQPSPEQLELLTDEFAGKYSFEQVFGTLQ